MSRADALTKDAWCFRYPGAPYEPTPDEGRTAFNLAREVMEAILGRLPLEVRPLRTGTGLHGSPPWTRFELLRAKWCCDRTRKRVILPI
jgi:hypothetical protein